MSVDLGMQVLADPFLPQEFLEKISAVFEVVPAYAPLPGLAVLQTRGIVAGAALHAPWAARFGQRVRQRCWWHREQEGRLFKAWWSDGFIYEHLATALKRVQLFLDIKKSYTLIK